MKKQNLILEEVLRIQNVMGLKVTKPMLVNEATQSYFASIAASTPRPPSWNRLSKLFRNAEKGLEKVEKSVENPTFRRSVVDSIEMAARNYGLYVDSNVMKNYQNLIQLAETRADVQTSIGDIISQMTKEDYDIAREFVDVYFESFQAILEYQINQKISAGIDKETAINDSMKSMVTQMETNISNNVAREFEKTYNNLILVREKAPIELNTTTKIQDFQNWLDISHSTWATSKKKDPDLGYGKLDGVTAEAWAKYGDEYARQLQIGEKIRNLDYGKIKPEDANFIDRFFSTELTAFNLIRIGVGQWVKQLELKQKGEDAMIDGIFSKIQKLLDDYNKSLSTGTLQFDNTLIRDISADMMTLVTEKTSLDGLYQAIEDVLYKNVDISKRNDVSKVMKIIREQNPWSPNLPYEGSWVAQFIDESTWGRARREMLDKNTSRLKKFFQLMERTTAFMMIGASKSRKDWREAYKSLYGRDALKKLIKHLYLAKFVGMPLFMAFVKTILFGFASGFKGDREEYDGFFDMFGSYFLKYEANIFIPDLNDPWPDDFYDILYIVYGLLPVHNYAYDVYTTVSEFTGKLYSQKLAKLDPVGWFNEGQQKLDSLQKKFDSDVDKLTKRIEEMEKAAKEKGKEGLEFIEDKVDSFKEWSSQKGYQFDRYENGVGYTKDGKSYIYDDTDKTNPKFREPKIDGTESGFKDWAKINQKEFDKVTPTGIGVLKDGTQYEWDKTTWEEI